MILAYRKYLPSGVYSILLLSEKTGKAILKQGNGQETEWTYSPAPKNTTVHIPVAGWVEVWVESKCNSVVAKKFNTPDMAPNDDCVIAAQLDTCQADSARPGEVSFLMAPNSIKSLVVPPCSCLKISGNATMEIAYAGIKIRNATSVLIPDLTGSLVSVTTGHSASHVTIGLYTCHDSTCNC